MTSVTNHSTQKAVRPRKKTRWLIRLCVALVSFTLLLLILAPVAIKTGLQQWLSEQTASEVRLAEVKLNLFEGKFSLRGLTVPARHGDQTPATSAEYASVDLDMAALLRQKIVIQRITLSHAQIVIDRSKQQLQIAGIMIPETPPETTAPSSPEGPSDPPKFAINSIKLESVTLDYHSDEIDKAITIDNTTIKNISTLQAADAIQVAVTLEIDKSQIDYRGEVKLFTDTPSLQGTLGITRLDIASFNPLIPKSSYLINNLGLSLSTTVSAMLPKKGAPHFNITGHSTLSDIDIISDNGDPVLKLAEVEINKIDFQYPGSATGAEQDAVKVALNISTNKGKIDYQGELFIFSDTPAFRGNLTIDAFDVTPFTPLLPLPGFALNQLNISLESTFDGSLSEQGEPRINLTGQSSLNDLDIISTAQRDTYVKSKAIEIKQINVQYPERVSIGEIVVDSINGALFRDSEGKLLSLQETSPANADQPSSVKTDATHVNNTNDQLALSPDRFSIKGDSSLLFQDAAVTPLANIKLQPLTLMVGRIDNQQTNAETPVSLNTTINDTGKLKIEGNVTPLAKAPKVMLNTQLAGLALPILSPYTEKHIGYELRRGRLSVDSALTIDAGELKADNKLTLTKLSIKERDPEKAKGLINQLEMPLDSALDLLRDKEENITFTLPVEGKLDDPQFKLDGVIKLALGKGMKMAAMNYLANALQPLGTILLAKDLVGVATKPRFKSLSFNPGEAALSDNMQAYLDKIGALLKKRPQLSITLCGIANGNDRAALTGKAEEIQQQLHRIAKSREENARNYLIAQQEISASRLFECNPKVSDKMETTEGLIEGVEIFL